MTKSEFMTQYPGIKKEYRSTLFIILYTRSNVAGAKKQELILYPAQ